MTTYIVFENSLDFPYQWDVGAFYHLWKKLFTCQPIKILIRAFHRNVTDLLKKDSEKKTKENNFQKWRK